MSRTTRVSLWLVPLIVIVVGGLWYATQTETGNSQEAIAPQITSPEDVAEAPIPKDSVQPTEQASIPANPEQVEETRQPVVDTAAPAKLSGSIVDEQGDAIEGAHVSWTAWAQTFTEHSASKVLPSAEAIEQQTVDALTDAEGRFRFEQAPPGLDDATKSVVWITHAEHVARPYLLGEDRDSWPELDALILQPGSAMIALVRSAGQPLPGATISQRASIHRRPSRLTGETLEVLMPLPERPLLFLRTYESDAAGQALLVPMEEPQYIQAEHDGLVSMPWTGFGRPTVALDLAATFVIEGNASLPVLDENWGMPRVLVLRSRAGMTDEVAMAPVRADGSFGPLQVPLLPAEEYVARLDGGVVAPEELPFAPPQAGERIFLEFQAQAGSPLWYVGVDQDQEIIKGTEVSVTWESNGRRIEQQVRADDNGYVLVPATPPGEVNATISAPGYQTGTFLPISVPEPQAATHPIILREAGRIEGTCMLGDAPARNFEVRYWWIGNHKLRGSVIIRDSEDGKFVVDGAPPGSVGIEAFDVDYHRSRTEYVEVVLGTPATGVSLDLLAPRTARGKVVEAGSGSPLPGARIQLHSSDNYLLVDTIGPPDPVEADGSFEIAKLGPGIGVLLVEAPGRSSRLVHFREESGEVEELGVIELEPTQPLTVRILSDTPSQYAGYTVAIRYGPRLPALTFSAEGEAYLKEMSSGNYKLIVMDLAGNTMMESGVIFKSGEEWIVDFDFTGECDVTLQIVAGEDGVVPTDAYVGCGLTSPDGAAVTRYVDLDEQGRGLLTGVGIGSLDVWAQNSDGSAQGGASLNITSESREITLEIPLTSRPIHVRVVDHEGVPLAGVGLDVYNSTAPNLSCVARTGSGGECVFQLPEGGDRVTMTDSTGGLQTGVAFIYPGNGEETMEIVLDTRSSLRLRLTGDEVLPTKLACRLFDPVVGTSLVAPQKPDAQRLVTFTHIGPGDYRLQVSSGECWTVSQLVTIGEGQASASMELRRLGGLELKLRRSDGSLASNVPVELTCSDLNESVAQWIAEGLLPGASLTTDARGVLKLDGLPRGSYSWSCEGGSGKVEVIADTTEKKTLLLP